MLRVLHSNRSAARSVGSSSQDFCGAFSAFGFGIESQSRAITARFAA
ncbi:hypothetical protein PC116_g1782 [Phytophthora cactorum]|uniref:Uncharacterized protein n=1 Tax=Phytophthora cactorum TaxID=29920 RepID=A0A8T1LNP4_9STRA|nr:hypothetical protein Pcac1_g16182 [Phytophthora cactorum]KAG2935219.1 hypothetical protein PC114_g694 [Phytophthora cactorum]KAG2955296.1 hypothetical protein PC117_g544 [Phytophthora cactorum]KAG3040726.1 hypothetical protein PC119_g1244 [Phytophthora cactorum]KAG3192301.1 hypothetical protein C6341_g707 [Phytophthora cactorum]